MEGADHSSALGTELIAIVAARNEAERIAATLHALAEAFPGVSLWVADDGSSDDTAAIARSAGANVARRERAVGKGGAMTLAARQVLGTRDSAAAGSKPRGSIDPESNDPSSKVAAPGVAEGAVVLLCDGDLGESAGLLGPLAQAVRDGEADLVVAAFARRVGGGFGFALGFARRTIERRCGFRARAPISGQRAVRADLLERLLPFADGFGMEVGMTIDAVRAGARVREIELDLAHRATRRTPAGFAHRARQLVDFVRVYRARR